jgi:hypothetical protein
VISFDGLTPKAEPETWFQRSFFGRLLFRLCKTSGRRCQARLVTP